MRANGGYFAAVQLGSGRGSVAGSLLVGRTRGTSGRCHIPGMLAIHERLSTALAGRCRLERFVQEITSTASLPHPHILRPVRGTRLQVEIMLNGIEDVRARPEHAQRGEARCARVPRDCFSGDRVRTV